MKKFMFELHAHTSEVSRCGKVGAQELIRLYRQAGYHGVVITDHISDDFNYLTNGISWQGKIDFFLRGYLAAKEAAGNGFTVLLGLELTFNGSETDYLVYGITEEFLRKHEELCKYGIFEFSKIARENKLLVYQAHPFRNNMTITRPNLLDGIEVYNANLRHDSRNDIALIWADKFDLKKISGSDFHQEEDVARGGIVTEVDIQDNKGLFEALQGEYELIITKEP